MELFQFFLDSDTVARHPFRFVDSKDRSGDISLQEYVDYAAMLG